MTDRFNMTDRVVIVTGASSGLGAHFTEVLVDAGATVVAVARRAERLEALRHTLGASVHPMPCDVTDTDAISAVVAWTIESFGHLDVLVNNAGVSTPRASIDFDVDAFRDVLAVNLIGPFAFAQAAARAMTDGGAIVNVGSILGLVAGGGIHDSAYAASKAGLVHLTRQLADEWAPLGIRVNALAPGWFRTEMNDEMFTEEKTMRWMERNTPMRRSGELAELDGPLLLLASNAGAFMTGHTLVVDGGWTIR